MTIEERIDQFVDSQIDLSSVRHRWGLLLMVPILLVAGVIMFLALEGHIVSACLSTGPGFIAIFQWVRYVMRREAVLVARDKAANED